MGRCPLKGGGLILMIRTAVSENIVLATCQDKDSEIVKTPENPKTPGLSSLAVTDLGPLF